MNPLNVPSIFRRIPLPSGNIFSKNEMPFDWIVLNSPGPLIISSICCIAVLFILVELPLTFPQISGFLPACFCKAWPATVSPPFFVVDAESIILDALTVLPAPSLQETYPIE